MATIPKSEYVGFTVNERSRVYELRVSQPNGEFRHFSVSISNRAFLKHRVRYQDAPVICFLKLERELEARGQDKAQSKMRITDAELAEYLESHERRPSTLRPRPNVKP